MLLRCGLWGVGSSGENPGQSLKRPWPASVFYSWVASLAMPFREWKVSWNGESEDDLVAPAPSLSHNIYTLQNALLLNFSMWKNHYTNARNHFLPTLFITCNITSVLINWWFCDEKEKLLGIYAWHEVSNLDAAQIATGISRFLHSSALDVA